jgi:hypothetical protein
MHHHFKKCYGGDANIFEVVGVFLPWLLVVDLLLLLFGVAVEGVAGGVEQFDGVFELCKIGQS